MTLPNPTVDIKENYPLNKEQASTLLDMTSHPGWSIFMECLRYEESVYIRLMQNLEYGPNALEKFRFYQALANNIGRIPNAVLEVANDVIDDKKSLNSIYDDLYLNSSENFDV